MPGSCDISGVLVKVQSQGKTGSPDPHTLPQDLLFLRFIYFCLHSVFIAARGLSLTVPSGGPSPVAVHRPPAVVASRCSLQQELCAPAQLPLDMCDLPGAGLEPASPALAGRFLVTGSPGKPSTWGPDRKIGGPQSVHAFPRRSWEPACSEFSGSPPSHTRVPAGCGIQVPHRLEPAAPPDPQHMVCGLAEGHGGAWAGSAELSATPGLC